ncbi:nuclease-related domain-containing protein [Streptomyces marianii]|uniref:NERD domain-containing protein n=1 Tax=Streptomyces marianii TaxID=1817406 RepID=A0A5R9DS36_9ACTN|nr:nuclease-related domain-containing protein [Streptomyces marianii]TLQ39410.1 NERD domain-containing protein [Streptomyces marianii]
MPTRPKRRSGAGASAQAMADSIRATERRRQHRTAAWAIPLMVAPVALAAGYFAACVTNWQAGTAVALVTVVLALRRIYRTKGSTWATGAAGERRTRWILAPLVWFGLGRWAVLHDRQIPRSRANLDHLVLGKCGPVYVDTKTWKAKNAKVHMRGGTLWYGRHPQQKTLETVQWEASRAAEVLGHRVQAVVAVHHAAVPPGGLVSHGVTIIQSTELRRFLRALPKEPGWDRARVRQAALLAEQHLRPAA